MSGERIVGHNKRKLEDERRREAEVASRRQARARSAGEGGIDDEERLDL